MNDTIRKLANQADAWCDQNWLNHPSYDVQWEQKFAELLIKECMRLVNNCYEEPAAGHTSYLTACASTIIEEYFGVKNA